MDDVTRNAALHHMGTTCDLEWQRAGGRPLTAAELAELRGDIVMFFDCLEMGDPTPAKACPCGSLDPSACSAGRCVTCCRDQCSEQACRQKAGMPA